MFFKRWHALWSVPLAFACPAEAETLLLDFMGYPQEKDQYCWAATAQSVINSSVFNPTQSTLKTQCDVVEAAGKSCSENDSGNPRDALRNLLPSTYVTVETTGALSFSDLKLNLKAAEALPIPFGIRYCNVANNLTDCQITNIGGGDNGSSHFMLVTGFSEENGDQQVSIYDPWPKDKGNPALTSSDPTDANSTQYKTQGQLVSYNTFANDVSSLAFDRTYLGVPYRHLHDYLVQPRAQLGPQPMPPTNVCVDGNCPGPADQWSLASSIRFSAVVSDSRMAASRHLEMLNRRRGSSSDLQIAEPLPILALDIASLVAAERNPTSLLTAVTARVVYPVVLDGAVRDAFILNRAVRRRDRPTWLEGGFANAQIVAQLVNARSRQSIPAKRRTPYYLISIPHMRLFLLAQGIGRNATLIALADRTDLTLSSREGDYVRAGASYPARVLMPTLSLAARRLQAG